MKKFKKVFALVFLSFLLSGCSVDYNLIINENYIRETSFLYSDDSYEYNNKKYRGYSLKTNFEALAEMKQSVFVNDRGLDISSPTESDNRDNGTPLYVTSYVGKTGLVGAKFKYDFSFEDYKDSYIVNTQMRTFSFKNSDGNISLTLGDTYLFTSYRLLDTINVIITVSDVYDVVSNDADIINNNEYLWTITRDNYIGKTINLSLKNKYYSDNNDNNDDDSDNNNNPGPDSSNDKQSNNRISISTIVILSLGIIIIVGISLVLFEKKSNKDRI